VTWRQVLLQIPAYAAFAALIGYFSSQPAWRLRGPQAAVVKVSFVHAGERKVACRERTAEELARLAPNMRAALDCPRERSDVKIEVEMDGRVIFAADARPAGLRHDMPSSVYQRFEVPAGHHTFRARLADTADSAFRHDARASVDLAPGRVLVIDFTRGAFEFRS
jgi:hypothetical protein